jgi:hypothetical protein
LILISMISGYSVDIDERSRGDDIEAICQIRIVL